MTPPAAGPWTEHRLLAEAIGQSVADAIAAATGAGVELGMAASFEPELSLPGRPVPLRAIVVRFRRPLRDVMVFLTSQREEVVRPMVEAAAAATIAALDVPTDPDQHGPLGRFDVDDAIEYESIDLALEQTDALFLEAGYTLELPIGEMLLVVGTGLLESANCFANGIADPYAVEATFRPSGSELELGDEIGATDGDRYELGDAVIGSELADQGLETAAPAAPAAEAEADDAAQSAIDAYDAMLAAQEQAEAEAAAAIAATNAAAAASAPVAPGAMAPQDSERWTQLLSGVEVELSAELGRTDLTLGDITSLDSESVLTLDQLVHEPVDVYVNGTRYATARLVMVDGEYGIEILEVVDQELLATTLAA